VHHRAAGDRDVDGAPGPTTDVDHRVLDLVAAVRVIRNGVQFTGFRVMLGMCGVSPGQCPVKIAHPDGVQFIGEFVTGNAALDQCQGLPGVPDHVGVGAD